MRDAFICDGVRTPVGRYGGGLAGVRADDLGQCRCVRCWHATRSSTWNVLMM
jgi:hypothetical protein